MPSPFQRSWSTVTTAALRVESGKTQASLYGLYSFWTPGCERSVAQVSPTPFWRRGTEKQLLHVVPMDGSKPRGVAAGPAGLPVLTIPGIALNTGVLLSSPH